MSQRCSILTCTKGATARPPLSHGPPARRCLALQSTYCETIKQHCDTIGRTVHLVNLGESCAAM